MQVRRKAGDGGESVGREEKRREGKRGEGAREGHSNLGTWVGGFFISGSNELLFKGHPLSPRFRPTFMARVCVRLDFNMVFYVM